MSSRLGGSLMRGEGHSEFGYLWKGRRLELTLFFFDSASSGQFLDLLSDLDLGQGRHVSINEYASFKETSLIILVQSCLFFRKMTKARIPLTNSRRRHRLSRLGIALVNFLRPHRQTFRYRHRASWRMLCSRRTTGYVAPYSMALSVVFILFYFCIIKRAGTVPTHQILPNQL